MACVKEGERDSERGLGRNGCMSKRVCVWVCVLWCVCAGAMNLFKMLIDWI